MGRGNHGKRKNKLGRSLQRDISREVALYQGSSDFAKGKKWRLVHPTASYLLERMDVITAPLRELLWSISPTLVHKTEISK